MVELLRWSEGEGSDIHVVRGRTSKALRPMVNGISANPIEFVPHFSGAPDAQGVRVNTATGEVTVLAQYSRAQSKLRNFLMTARETDPSSQAITAETKIRVHVHESVVKIWLTPSVLPVHDSATGTRFTVLAEFDDGVVGDVSEWLPLTWRSLDSNVVDVGASNGLLTAKPERAQAEMDVQIEATHEGLEPATAHAAAKPSWAEIGERAKVEWVTGPKKPKPKKLRGPDADSVESVVANAANILFISEGFSQGQEKAFRAEVKKLVTSATGLLQPALQPFKLLERSINYWSVFVPSREDGVSLLGLYFTLPKRRPQDPQAAAALTRPLPPDASSHWSIEQMIHEVGLPTPTDAEPDLQAWVARWQQVYGPHISASPIAWFDEWRSLSSCTPLNERGTAFGIENGVRARMSDARNGIEDNPDGVLKPSPRRTKESDIRAFIAGLRYGEPAADQEPFDLGETWGGSSKDAGLVCLVCLSDLPATQPVRSSGSLSFAGKFFTVTSGVIPFRHYLGFLITIIKKATSPRIGWDPDAALLPKEPYEPRLFAALVAHGLGHAVGLGDEYGAATPPVIQVSPAPPPPPPTQFPLLSVREYYPPLFVSGFDGRHPNIQRKADLSPLGAPMNPDRIQWLHHRASKVGMTSDDAGDIQHQIQPPAPDKHTFKLTHKHKFKPGDKVVFRVTPPDRADAYKDFRFDVVSVTADTVTVEQPVGSMHFKDEVDNDITFLSDKHILLGLITQGLTELTLVSPVVLTAMGGPAPSPLTGQACVAQPSLTVTPLVPSGFPSNRYPTKSKRRPSEADVIGLYEGGANFDCEVFHPAGRCQMRARPPSVTNTVPFCHVCRHVIVERINPRGLPDLDALYDPFYPG